MRHSKAIIFKNIVAIGAMALLFVSYTPNRDAYIERFDSRGPIYAQGQSTQGGSNSLIMFTKEVGGVPEDPIACPTGWTEVVYGYGPHYIALFNYDWLNLGGWDSFGFWWVPPPPTGGGVPTGGGAPPPDSRDPTDPPPPPEPEPVPTPGGGPPIPGEEDQEGNPLDPEDRVSNGGDGGPPWSNGADGRGGDQQGSPPEGSLIQRKSFVLGDFFSGLIKTAQAQVAYTYILKDVAIGSDSICSFNSLAVIDEQNLYRNNAYGTVVPKTVTFADACTATECNRCRICVK